MADNEGSGRGVRRTAGTAAGGLAGRGLRALAKSPVFWIAIGVAAGVILIFAFIYTISYRMTTTAAVYITDMYDDNYMDGAVLPLSAEVEQYRSLVYAEAEKYGKEEYTDLFLAVMQQESGGHGTTDVFQCSESLGKDRNSLTVEASVNQGVKLLCGYLDDAGVTAVTDIIHIRLALQAYNYGNGYISYAKNRDGGWTQENADAFAEEQHNKNPSSYPLRTGTKAERLGEWGYGDQYYTDHVLQYYPYAFSQQYSVSAGTAGTTSTSERLTWLFDGSAPTTSAQMAKYLIRIQVPIVDTYGNESTMWLTVHRKLADDITECFEEMARIGFPVKASDTSCYCWRMKTSGKSLSHHSYGSAIDINASSNPQIGYTGKASDYKPGTDPYAITSQVVAIWKSHGFYWGGDWTSSTDYMHFTYCNQ